MIFGRLPLIVSLALIGTQALAQTNPSAPRNIFEALESELPGEGKVVIEQSARVRALVGSVASRYSSILGREGNATIVMGYRIQFFNGNMPTAKAEAHSRASQLRRVAPGLSGYIRFNAPFWKLLIGDFASREEAEAKRRQIVSLLPAWGKEAYVIRDKVRILNYRPSVSESNE